MALPTQPNGSSVVSIIGTPTLTAIGTLPVNTSTAVTQKTLNTSTGQTESATVSVIQ